MWTTIARIILRNRILILVIIGLITAFMAYQATNVKLSYEYAKLLPESDTASINYEKFKAVFGEETNKIILGISEPDFYSLDKFNAWYDLCEELDKMEGIENILSATHCYNLVKNTEIKQFELDSILDRRPTSQAEVDSIASVIKSLPIYRNGLFNDSSDVQLLFISLSSKKFNSPERLPLIDNIVETKERFEKEHNIKTHISGLPFIRTAITYKLKSEMVMFVILAFALMIVILFFFFRSAKSVIISMTIVAIGVIWTFGSIELFNFKITILTSLVPPLLIVIGIPNSIFLINKYHNEYKQHGNKVKALQSVIRKIGNAIFLTNLTTASGFATFIITSSTILKEFGIVASVNIMALFFLSILIIPILFSFLSPPSPKQTKHLDSKLMRRAIKNLIHYAIHSRKVVYIITIALIIAAIIGVTFIKSTGFMCDDIPHNDPVYVDLKFFEKHFNGIMPLEISIDTKKQKGALKLSNLNKISKLQKRLETYPELSRSLAITDIIKHARQTYYNGNVKKYGLPNNMDMGFILSYSGKNIEQKNFKQSLVDTTKAIARVTFQVADIGTTEMDKMAITLQNEIDSIFPPEKFNAILTGTSIIFTRGTAYLVKNLFISLGLAIFLIAIFMSIMFSSVRMVLASLIPNLIPLLFTAALMGYFGVAIKPSTILVFSIAFGISVDDTIHFLAKYRQELRVHGFQTKPAVVSALKETGISMIYTSIVLFFGFGIFSASSFGGYIALGILVAFTLLIAMLTNLVLLPSLLLSMDSLDKKKQKRG